MPHRYFASEIDGATAALTGPDAHHLGKVMRAKPGDAVILCDGAGFDYTAAVTSVTPDRVEFALLEKRPTAAEPSVEVTLFAGYPKQDKLEHIIQKATELGAARIVPFFSRFCVAAPKNEEKKHARYARIAFEAAKQAGRGIIPEVGLPLTYPQMLAEAAAAQSITGQHPVMLLDDVLSELDDMRQSYLLSRMEQRQTIVTACDAGLFCKTDGKVLYVKQGTVSQTP